MSRAPRSRSRSTPTALACVLPIAVLCGCGGGAEPLPTASVYSYAGSVQCTDGGVSLAVMERQLVDGGVTVLASSCGTDGMARIAVCGAPDGSIGIFEIPSVQVGRARSLSFLPLSDLPGAGRVPCR